MVCANSYDLFANRYLFFMPCFASWSACSFPSMFVWAFILYSVMGCVRFCSISTIDVNIVLSAWLLWWVGCLMCVLSTYRQFRQYVNIWAVSFGYFLVIIQSVLCMAISSALKLVWSPGSLLDICTSSFVGL